MGVSTSINKKAFSRWRMMALGMMMAFALILQPQTASAAQINANIIVSPHPDDEMESWSLIENSPDNYEIFAYMTRGSDTIYCNQDKWQAAVASKNGWALNPSPAPVIKNTPECKAARMESTRSFLAAMGAQDSSLPQGYTSYTDMTISGLSVRKYDGGPQGMALFFDNPDGGLTQQQVIDSVRAIINNRNALGVPSNLRFTNIIGGYRNMNTAGCYVYNHTDHATVHAALWNYDFGTAGAQMGSTCRNDSDVSRIKTTTPTNWDYAFQASGGTFPGKHYKYYGWLSNPSFPIDGSGSSQNGIYNRYQTFWQRF